jgi:hypothetical protein
MASSTRWDAVLAAEAIDTVGISGLAGGAWWLVAAEFPDKAVFCGGAVAANGSLSVIAPTNTASFSGSLRCAA